MKKILLFTCLFLLFILQAYSQTDPFVVKDGGKVIMKSGDTIIGFIKYDLSIPLVVSVAAIENINSDNAEDIKIKPKLLNIANIKEFFLVKQYKGRHYYPVALMGFGYVINKDASKIKILQLDSKSEEKTNNQYTVVKEYYIILPDKSSPASFSDIRLMPFHKKMSKAVESCPSLSQKILNKETGYKFGLIFTEDQKMEVVKKIADEFENCK